MCGYIGIHVCMYVYISRKNTWTLPSAIYCGGVARSTGDIYVRRFLLNGIVLSPGDYIVGSFLIVFFSADSRIIGGVDFLFHRTRPTMHYN